MHHHRPRRPPRPSPKTQACASKRHSRRHGRRFRFLHVLTSSWTHLVPLCLPISSTPSLSLFHPRIAPVSDHLPPHFSLFLSPCPSLLLCSSLRFTTRSCHLALLPRAHSLALGCPLAIRKRTPKKPKVNLRERPSKLARIEVKRKVNRRGERRGPTDPSRSFEELIDEIRRGRTRG